MCLINIMIKSPKELRLILLYVVSSLLSFSLFSLPLDNSDVDYVMFHLDLNAIYRCFYPSVAI